MPLRLFVSSSILIALATLLLYLYEPLQAHTPRADGMTTIEYYLQQHISDISPKKEAVGRFYLTELMAYDGKGVVSYEDEQTAYTADFSYTLDRRGKPLITSFVIRSQ